MNLQLDFWVMSQRLKKKKSHKHKIEEWRNKPMEENRVFRSQYICRNRLTLAWAGFELSSGRPWTYCRLSFITAALELQVNATLPNWDCLVFSLVLLLMVLWLSNCYHKENVPPKIVTESALAKRAWNSSLPYGIDCQLLLP